MKTNISTSAAERTNRVINDFGAKIGGARKDLYQAARDWADRLADITAGDLAKAGLSKLVKLPNLEKLAEVGAISEEAARAALVIWRSIDRKPTYGVTRWAEATREKLDAIAAALVHGNVDEDTANAAEFKVLTAANWPAQPFTFGKYSVCFSRYNGPRYLRIYSGRFYCGDMSDDAASIAAQVRTMTAADEAKAADRRAAGPALSVYKNRAGQYFITPEGRPEIVLHTYETNAEAFAARNNDRAALIARYNALKTFPDCRRDWNRPRVGEDWRKGENMTPEAFAAALPFRGVEFGNWVNQTERAALLNSAFDGFHDLAAVLGITPAAVCLNGSLAFAFASRGHSKAAAHYETARRVINLTKKNGAGCMAHEWFHAVDNMAAGGGVNSFATEGRGTAGAILDAIKKTDFYKRSAKMAGIKGSAYWIEGRELAARAFEGVCAVLLNAAGICSDFLVNCLTMDEFTALDVERRADYYPYPTADEAAALLPYYVAFLNEFFGGVTVPAAALADSERAARKAEADRIAAEKLAEERRAARRAQIEAEKKAAAEKAAAEEKAREERAAATVASVRDMLEARHFDFIATAFDASTVYAIGHHQGEIYTLSADIATAEEQGENYINSLSAACVHYKRVHNAKRIIFAYGRPEVRANNFNAAEFVQSLTPEHVRHIVGGMKDYETADAFAHAEKVYQDTQRAHAEQQQRAKATANAADQSAPAEGLQLVEIPGGVAVVSDDWRATYANRRAIKAHGARWNKDAKQWQATDAEAVAMLRNWFGVAHNEQPAEPEHVETPAEIHDEKREFAENTRVIVTSLQAVGTVHEHKNGKYLVIFDDGKGTGNSWHNPEELATVPDWIKDGAKVYNIKRWRTGEPFTISDAAATVPTLTTADGFKFMCNVLDIVNNYTPHAPEAEPNAPVLPDWLKVGAKVRTRGRYMMTTRSSRPAWVEGEEMEITAITADWVSLKSDTTRESISTTTAAEELTPIYNPEPAAIAASLSTSDGPRPAWRYVINEVGNCCDAYDLPAFLTLEEAKNSNHLHAETFTTDDGETLPPTHILCEYSEEGDEGTNRIAYGATHLQALWNYKNGYFGLFHAEHGQELPAWLRPGVVFALVDSTTGEPTGIQYTAQSIDHEARTITTPESRDSFREGSNVYPFSAFYWQSFAPVNPSGAVFQSSATEEEKAAAPDFVEALKAIVNNNIGHHVFTIDGHEIEIYTPNDKHPLWIVAPSIFEHMQMTFDEVAEYLQQESRKKEPEQPTAPDSVALRQTEVTNPIKAEDLDTPRVFKLSERRDIVTGCTPEQAGELEHMGGKPSADGVVFRTSKENRYRLHVWQNEQSRKKRAEILGEGWQYVSGLHDSQTHAKPGDVVACVDGTRGICTQSNPESCVIEFQTKKGQRLSVAGYFLKQA